MAWTEPKGDTIDIKTKNMGTQFIGTYTGHKTVKTQLGDNTIWQFQDPEGVPFGIWGFTNLNFQMERVGVGMNCRITYKGKSQMKNKYGKFPHQVKVEIETDEGGDVVEAGNGASEVIE